MQEGCKTVDNASPTSKKRRPIGFSSRWSKLRNTNTKLRVSSRDKRHCSSHVASGYSFLDLSYFLLCLPIDRLKRLCKPFDCQWKLWETVPTRDIPVRDQKLGDQILCVYELSNLTIDNFKQMVSESGRRQSAEYSSSSKQLQTLMGRERYVAGTGQKDRGSFSCGRRI